MSPRYVIRSHGTQSNALCLDPKDWKSIARFATRDEAQAYADEITPCQPSKYLPLCVELDAPTGCSYCERTDTARDDWTTRCIAGTGCNTDDGGPFDPFGLS